jgi:hypothetical protein
MSRTRHHRNQRNRHCGRDLWSRRPCAGLSYCAESKRMTRRLERARKAADIRYEFIIEEI